MMNEVETACRHLKAHVGEGVIVTLQLPLYTHNLKHFTPLLDDLTRKPYSYAKSC